MSDAIVLGIATILAVILAPAIAVEVQRRLQLRAEKRGRRIWIFKALMATRASRISTEHVTALNMIEVEFHGDEKGGKEVVYAWRSYLDHLNTPPSPPEDPPGTWQRRSEELFVSLLFKMATALDYSFDEVLLKKGYYAPRGHGELEDDQFLMRKGLVSLLTRKAALRMDVDSFPYSEDEAKEQQKLRQLCVESFEGKRAIPVIVVTQDGQEKPPSRPATQA
jgi:hypothetical protein